MKLRKKEKKSLLIIGLFTYMTGAILFIQSKWVRVQSNVGEQHHPSEHWVRIAHTLVTYLIIIAFGYLVKGHILPGLRSRTKKRVYSGLGNIGLFFILTLTAVIILYSSNEFLTNSMSLTHSIIGLGCPLLIFMHSRKKVP